MARIILGVTGGIAAYKATSIIRELTEAGHSVKVIPTQNALRFIGATTLEALSHNTVDSDLYTDVSDVKHVKLGQEADLVIVAPATAAFLARYANGIADDLLLNTLLVTQAPVIVAPAMHSEMWLHAATKQNVDTLVGRGVRVIEPATGRLTGSDSGPGRLPEPSEIVRESLALLGRATQTKPYLEGKRALVTLGGTREPIDPVRFLGNASSGLMGLAFVDAALKAGATVTVVAANVERPSSLSGVDWIVANTASEMQAQVEALASSFDIVLMAAAVADFRPAESSQSKIKKTSTGDDFQLNLVANPDILANLCRNRTDNQVIIGFAAETTYGNRGELIDIAREKLERKGCDYLLANDVSSSARFGSSTTCLNLISKSADALEFCGSKSEVASDVLHQIFR